MATKSKPNGAKDGAPRWSYVVAAIVAAGGLLWGIVSYFIPEPELPKPTIAAPAPDVTVSGSGNVGEGTMSGGQISVGASAASPAPKPTNSP
jgi:hypothetical protein